jgi:dUTP pyrophosphatase
MKINVKIKKTSVNAKTPLYATSGAAGFDFQALDQIIILPQQTVIIKTGLCMEIPEGYELQIRPRSGTSYKTSLRIANSPGTIDSDFRGEIGIIVTNIDTQNSFTINEGDRIAQGVLSEVIQANFEEVEFLSETQRGQNGFGSTGK